jgi:hypothetical protein
MTTDRDGNETRTRWEYPKPEAFGTGMGWVIGYGTGYEITVEFFRGYGTGMGFGNIPAYSTYLPDNIYPFIRLYTRHDFIFFYLILCVYPMHPCEMINNVRIFMYFIYKTLINNKPPCTLDRRQQWPTSRSFGHSDSEVRDSSGCLPVTGLLLLW